MSKTWTQSCSNIRSAATEITSAFNSEDSSTHSERLVKWNSRNHEDHILNVDGSCIGTPSHSGYGGVLRNSVGLFISGCSCFIPNSTDILLAELTAIQQGLNMAIDLNMNDLMCYSDSLLVVNLIMNDTPRFHIYVVLIQNIKDLLVDRNISLHHTLREGNQCADYFAKLGTNSDAHLVIHQSPPADLLPLLRADVIGTFFVRS
jgi:ribonuclease HI